MRLSASVIPHDGHSLKMERLLVAAANGILPSTIVGFESAELIFIDIVLEPLTQFGMSRSEEVHQILAACTAAHHVEIEIALHLRYFCEMVGEVLRTEQSLLLTVPESEHYSTLGLSSTRYKCLHNLQHGSNARSIVVGTIVYLVASDVVVHALMVEMCAHHNIFVSLLAGQHSEHIAKRHRLIYTFLNLGYRVGIDIETHAALELLHSASLKRLLVRIAQQRLQSCLTYLRDDVLLGYTRTTLACTATLKQVVGEEIHVSTCSILGDCLHTGFNLSREILVRLCRILLCSKGISSHGCHNDSR